jgi:hypothetical protein
MSVNSNPTAFQKIKKFLSQIFFLFNKYLCNFYIKFEMAPKAMVHSRARGNLFMKKPSVENLVSDSLLLNIIKF